MREQVIPVFYDAKSAVSTQYSNIIQGIRTTAARNNISLQLISDNHPHIAEEFATLPPVAILTGTNMPFIQEVIVKLRKSGRHAVLAGIDSEQFGHDISCATPSRRAETQQLVNYLYNCGKEHIALVGFGRNSINDNFRYHAAMSAVTALGKILKESDRWLWEQDPNESFEKFIVHSNAYDAVICPNDIIAICLINFCKTCGLSVPDSFYVASFGNMSIGRFYRPSITSMTMDMLYVGAQAFSVWRFLMNNDSSQQTSLKLTVPSRLLVRESTANRWIEPGMGKFLSELQEDRFYSHPTISMLVNIENCISQRDAIDMRIIQALMNKCSYEQISDELYIGSSTLRYRLNKIYADAGVHNRLAFETLINTHLCNGNPFDIIDL